jgi:hemolysin D
MPLDLTSFSNRLFPDRPRHELEFLPAALEIIETPASPAGRVVMLTLVALAAIVLIWSCFGRLDIIATAEGRVIPSGRVKIIQPFETGVVKSIAVHDGEHVHKGDLLIELDPTINAAEKGHVTYDLTTNQIDAARLEAQANGSDDLTVPDGANADDVATAQHLLTAARTEQRAKLENISHQLDQKQAEAAETQATIDKLKAALPWIQKRRDTRKYLADNEYGSKFSYLDAQQQLVEQQHELEVQQHKLDESNAAVAALHQQYAQTDAEFQRSTLDDLAKDKAKIGTLTQDEMKAEERTELQTLRSPVDGTVQQLAVHTVGGVVTPAQQLLIVVPDDAKLEIEANVLNKDVGFVHAGQPAEIKVEAFTFTRYGLLHGTVKDISHDAAPIDDHTANDEKQKAEDEQSKQAQKFAYIAHVALNETTIQTETGPQNLSPGMVVTVEIKTGRRRVIDYLLSPLKRYHQEGLRER